MAEVYRTYLLRALPLSVIGILILLLYGYIFLPTNVGYVFWGLVLLLIFGLAIIGNFDQTSVVISGGLIAAISGLLIISMITGPMVFTRIDNAKYFDDILIYDEGLPFTTKINGSELRVVDQALARSIMDKSNPFGSNAAVYSIHLGNYGGHLYWIGAAIFDGLILNDAKNRVIGFIAVDITDPTIEPIIIRQEFEVDPNLIFNHDLHRTVWRENINYLLSDNAYFSYNDDADQMELIVPYAIKDAAFLGSPFGGLVTSDMELDGGVLIIGSTGEVISDIKDRSTLPKHAKIQMYAESWLERHIQFWGRSLVADNDVRWSTGLPWVKSERKLGVDDDVRVVINPDARDESVQYILLDSTDSTNQILRGAIKVNESGLHYYNWEQFNFIDTNTAHEHVEETIVSLRQTSTHGYNALLPILYPVKDNVTSLRDYAYVMPLQLGQSRFGGIAITDPSDKTGTRSIVEFVESEQIADVSSTVAIALDRYNALVEGGNGSISGNLMGNYTIDEKREFITQGSSVYAMEGNFSALNESIQVIFDQSVLLDEKQWLKVVFADIGDTLKIEINDRDGIYYATKVYDS